MEDIGQEVFLSVYKSIRNFDVSAGTPFLLGIVNMVRIVFMFVSPAPCR